MGANQWRAWLWPIGLETISKISSSIRWNYSKLDFNALVQYSKFLYRTSLLYQYSAIMSGWKSKVWRVFVMVVVSILPHLEFGPNDHRKDASHFTPKKFWLETDFDPLTEWILWWNDSKEWFTFDHFWSESSRIFLHNSSPESKEYLIESKLRFDRPARFVARLMGVDPSSLKWIF